MSRYFLFCLGLMLSLGVYAQNRSLEGFKQRFTLVRNTEGKVTLIKLKKAVTTFTIRPFIEQIKSDLTREQASFTTLSYSEKVSQVENLLSDMELSQDKNGGFFAAQIIREALLNIEHIDINASFVALDQGNFWVEFQKRLQEAFLLIDPTILANLEDGRFFYKKNVTYKVVEWALREAQKRFSNLPVLNIASFVIVRVHEMMLEQRSFHHNMLLHYFETIPETDLGMTKEEVDRAVSSIYEYRIDAANIFESNRAANDWLNYGMNIFYQQVRVGNGRIREWQGPFSPVRFQDIKKLNFAFASLTEGGARKIYHLHHTAHQFSQLPALAFDYSNPNRVKKNRALLNLAGVALGFIKIPMWLKQGVDSFIKSFYVRQVRMEGALVGYFETTGDIEMIERIYSQRANFYIVR
jgi:hypothetical protein